MSRHRSSTGGHLIAIAAALFVVTVAATAALPSHGFTTGLLDRGQELDIVNDSGGVMELNTADSVAKNSIQTLVTVTNNHDRTHTVGVGLTNGDGADADLYFNANNVGDSVTFSLAPGDQKTVEVQTTLNQGSVLNYVVNATSPGFRFEAPRTTDVTGANANAIAITKLDKVSADAIDDTFTVGQVSAKDSDGDDDLVEARFTAFDGAGNTVGSTSDGTRIQNGGAKYQVRQQNPVTWAATTDLVAGQTYTVRLEVEDSDGNVAVQYFDVTA